MMISLAFLAALAAQVPPERANSTFTLSDSALEWSLWASEPLFCNPTTIDIDHLGRVWVCEAVNYRCTLFKKPLNRPEGDRILILEDSKGQGRADKVTVFAQAPYIQAPMGIAVAKDPAGPGWKVYVCQSPDILVFEDKDGDGKADLLEMCSGSVSLITVLVMLTFPLLSRTDQALELGSQFERRAIGSEWRSCMFSMNSGVGSCLWRIHSQEWTLYSLRSAPRRATRTVNFVDSSRI
jgi:hypothetical protein